MTARITAAIIGARGFAGAELAGLLAHHPAIELTGLYGGPDSPVAAFDDLHPRFRGVLTETVSPYEPGALRGRQMVFLATPPKASSQLAPRLLEEGHTVFDLSAAFRHARADVFATHYGFDLTHPELLEEALYALPEWYRGAIGATKLYALPGCFPTAIILAAAPLRSAGLIEPGRAVIADAVSGVSGAGRAPSDRTHFCGVSLEPYGVFTHRHAPEIKAHVGQDVIFTPHLGSFDRGILATVHIPLRAGTDPHLVREAIESVYTDAPWVRVLPEGRWPSIGAVRGTNFCDIGVAVRPEGDHAIVVSAIDNLLKGAAGQAVQVMNIHLGLIETLGLPGALGAAAGLPEVMVKSGTNACHA